MPIKRLREFLDSHAVRYFILSHSPAYTAQEIAASAHIPGGEMAKTVMVTIDGKMAMAVVPASRHLDFERLREVAGSERVDLADEKDFSGLFPECEIGAMPPFGNLYGMAVYMAEELAEKEEIVFNAGAHTELLRMSLADYTRLVHPGVADITMA